MKKDKLRGNSLNKIGYKNNSAIALALQVMKKHYKHSSTDEQLSILQALLQNPAEYLNHAILAPIAEILDERPVAKKQEIALKKTRTEFTVYGADQIEAGAINQMYGAMSLPVAISGALMPDAHYGFGLPIGGVLATRNEVIPYAVGMDIGCRMCLTIYDMPPTVLEYDRYRLKKILEENTCFGTNNGFDKPMDDEIFERNEFITLGIGKKMKDKAWKQIGSSGSGNHFVEFGIAEIRETGLASGLRPGSYLAILSHSGSRGLGAAIAAAYTSIAMQQCLLPGNMKQMAWLDLNSMAGEEYWAGMTLAGDYATACHDHIHKRLAKQLGEKPLMRIENHHNYAWKETLADGTQAVVHRKGATPAGEGVLGIIPGSMTAPGFIVRGKGYEASLNSASHGAGRAMSRSKAMQSILPSELKQMLKKHGVDLKGGSPDEAPMAYKDIHQVMKYQEKLVDVIGTFLPKIVRMA